MTNPFYSHGANHRSRELWQAGQSSRPVCQIGDSSLLVTGRCGGERPVAGCAGLRPALEIGSLWVN
jgi:hypothetical protein